MNKKLSVVTLTFNNYDELLETLSSFKDFENSESIVINGGSCPETEKYLRQNNIKHLSEKDDGIYDGFNKGVKLSSGEYILFLNSGDLLIEPKYWQDSIDFLNKNIQYDFTFSNIIFKDEIAGELKFKYIDKNLGRGMPYFHQTLIVRKKVFDEIGLFRKFSIAMDYDFVVRMLKSGKKGKYFDYFSVAMDGQGVSATKEWDSIKQTFTSLKDNHYITVANLLGLSKRVFWYLNRRIITFLFGKKLLTLLKKLKYKEA
jgi:glycosyltransferase involved in cell wall biosynthesis